MFNTQSRSNPISDLFSGIFGTILFAFVICAMAGELGGSKKDTPKRRWLPVLAVMVVAGIGYYWYTGSEAEPKQASEQAQIASPEFCFAAQDRVSGRLVDTDGTVTVIKDEDGKLHSYKTSTLRTVECL